MTQENDGVFMSEWIDRAVQTYLDDQVFRNVRVDVERDPMIRASIVTMSQELLDRVIYTEHRTTNVDAPGIWNGVKRLLPWIATPKVEVETVFEIHHNCPHLPSDERNSHLEWLSFERMSRTR